MSKGKGTGMNPTQEEELLREAFDIFDRDGSGKISTTEFGNVVRAVGLNPTDEEIDNQLKEFDQNNDRCLEFEEFKKYVDKFKQKCKNDEDAISRAFKMFDRDGNGFVDAAELQRILHQIGQILSDDEIKEMIDVADVDKDGRIDYREFAKFICKPIK